MKLEVKRFDELTLKELHDIYKLRVEVFVVEQHCPYREVDDDDLTAYHVMGKCDDDIVAYLRVMSSDQNDTAMIGRVLSMHRRRGIGSQLLKKGIEVAYNMLNADRIVIHAQEYAREFYERSGFVKTSERFMEDGIPHVEMTHLCEGCLIFDAD